MKIEQRYQELLKLRAELDEKLKDLNFEKIKELVLWLKKSLIFQKLKKEDNQLSMLDCFCNIWIEEKKQLARMNIHEDIFGGVQSLEDIEYKYLMIKYCALRIENEVPLEWCEHAVDRLIEYQVSGIAMGTIFIAESCKRMENIIKLARFLKGKGEIIKAVYLLQYADKEYPMKTEVLLELADCWLEGQQWQQAYECLVKIEAPDETVEGLILELEKVI